MPKRAPNGRNTAAAAEVKWRPVIKVAQELRRWTRHGAGRGRQRDRPFPQPCCARWRAGPGSRRRSTVRVRLLRKARRAARMTTRELGAAIDLSDPRLLELAETGKAVLPSKSYCALPAYWDGMIR